jgi:hypothetical protein
MTLLNKTSLAQTIDNVNEAFFYGKKISKRDADAISRWISSRLNTEYSYSGSFGLTAKDMRSKSYTFTGEPLTSPASLRHIMAEEASRVLIQLSEITCKEPAGLEQSTQMLMRCLKASEFIGKPEGTFCCGPCTVGLWRHFSVGGLGSYAKKMPKGIEVLEKFKDGKGAWGRFPFYYTLLALSEVNYPIAKKEIEYAMPQIEKKLVRLKPDGKFSQRRRDLLLKILNNS